MRPYGFNVPDLTRELRIVLNMGMKTNGMSPKSNTGMYKTGMYCINGNI